MKNLFPYIIILTIVFSCSNQDNTNANQIDLENLKLTDLVTACDYIDVLEELDKLEAQLLEGAFSKEETEEKYRWVLKRYRLKEIMKEKFVIEEVLECPNFKYDYW